MAKNHRRASLREKVIALAFPELVNVDVEETSFTSEVTSDYFVPSSEAVAPPERYTIVDLDIELNESMEDGSIYTSGSKAAEEEVVESNNNDIESFKDELDPEEMPSSPTTTETTVGNSDCFQKEGKQDSTCGIRMWIITNVVICVIIAAACALSTTFFLLGRNGNGFQPAAGGVIGEPSAVASNVTTLPPQNETTRFEEMRIWLDIDPSPGSPQHAALFWLAHRDLFLDDSLPPPSYAFDTSMIAAQQFRKELLQRYTLLVFYFATGQFSSTGWATMTGARLHECTWPGVLCENDRVVTGLELDPSVGVLKGTIPSEIGQLENLKRFFLSFNYLSGEVPSTIYGLSSLNALRLSNSNLTSTLRSEIANLQLLQFLELTNGGFSGTLPSELGLMTNLKFLFLSKNAVHGTIPPELGNLNILEKAFFHHSLLSGEMPSPVCELRNNSNLVSLSANCRYSVDPSIAALESEESATVACDCCTLCF